MAADAGAIAHITCTTNAAAAVGCIVAPCSRPRLMFKKWEATMALNGALAGLVADHRPLHLGFDSQRRSSSAAIAGVLVVLSVVVHRAHAEDRRSGGRHLGARRVRRLGHAVAGLVLRRARATLRRCPGLFIGGGATQLIAQAIGVGAVFAWCMVTGAICFFGIKYTDRPACDARGRGRRSRLSANTATKPITASSSSARRLSLMGAVPRRSTSTGAACPLQSRRASGFSALARRTPH